MMKTFAIIFLSVFFSSMLLSQETLTCDKIFLCYYKIQDKGINKKELIPFLERYHKEEYEEKSIDKDIKAEYINEKLTYYKNQLAVFNLGREFEITTYITLKEYDKTKQAFNLELEHYLSRGIINPSDKWGGTLDFVGKVSNIDEYRNLKMECDELINLFVNASPIINKDSVPVTINLRFYSTIYDEVNVFGSTKLFTGFIMCKINKLTYHFSDAEEYIYSK